MENKRLSDKIIEAIESYGGEFHSDEIPQIIVSVIRNSDEKSYGVVSVEINNMIENGILTEHENYVSIA